MSSAQKSSVVPAGRPLAGKVAIVTGASRGIGKRIAIELGARGAAIVVAARTIERRSRVPGTIGETVAAIEEVGADALAVRADMAIAEDLDRLVDTVTKRFGRVDVLVNNAAATDGKAWGASLLDLSRDEWMAQYAVNLHAPFTLIRSLAPVMAEHGGGRVINLTTAGHRSDEAAVPGLPNPLAYPSSKAALDEFTRLVAPQLRALGIAIVNVHPGFVRTEMVDLMVEHGLDASEAIEMDIPAQAVAFLASCDDPWPHTGRIVAAEELLQQIGEMPRCASA